MHGSNPPQPTTAGASFVAWLLLLMGIATFAVCILLPEWRDYQTARLAEQFERHRTETLREVVDRERRRIDAIQSDPAVIARLAQRELGYMPRGAEAVVVPVARATPAPPRPFTPDPVQPPSLVKSIAQMLPRLDYDAVFCHGTERTILIGMALVIIAVALAIPGRNQAR